MNQLEQHTRAKIEQFRQSCCISAGAGAGKTTCLVNAYLGLLEQGYSPQQIVVITFTEKAAAELGERIQKAVEEKGDLLNLERLQWAPISTIHSFCARLLREQAALCSLAPDFNVLDSPQFDRLLEAVIARLLRGWLKSQNQDLRLLLGQYEYGQMPAILSMLLKASYINNLSPDDILQATLREIGRNCLDIEPLVERAQQQSNELGPMLERQLLDAENEYLQVEQNCQIKSTKSAQNKLNKAARQLAAARQALANYRLMLDKWQQEAAPEELHAVLMTIGDNKKQDLLNALLNAQDLLDSLRQWAMQLKLELSREYSISLLALFSQLHKAVETELKRVAGLSFDHLIMKANQLFTGHPQFSQEFHERYRVVMVDEFQDVNPLQARLVQYMAGQEQDEKIRHIKSRLLVVGDRKQSVYGFRGADVSVFNQLRSQFAEFPQADSFAICNNYRSPKELVNFFNQFFNDIVFADSQPNVSYEVDYQPQNDDQFAGKEFDYSGQVEILDCSQPQQVNRQAMRQQEAMTIARHIKSMINQGEAAPGDMALLFRSFTRVELYAQALGQLNIPYYVDRGGNFYQQSEVIDLASGLGSLQWPVNNQALIGALLSPIFSFSLTDLLILMDDDNNILPNLRQNQFSQLSPPMAGLYQKATDFYNTYSALAHSMQPVELIGALLEDTGWQLRLAAEPDGAQKLANLRKLLEASRQPPMVHNPLDYLMNELKRAEREPMAPLLSGQANVVRLMTIHQAKGLEFPVVILPELVAAEPRNRPPEFFLLSQQGVMGLNMGIKFKSAISYLPLFAELLAEYRAREAAESARIFYVAVTRAKQGLVFSFFRDKRARSKWTDWVEKLLTDQKMQQAHNIKIWEAMADVGHDGLPQRSESVNLQQQIEQVQLNCQSVTIKQPLISTSVSILEEWLLCPRRGWLQQNMGIDWALFPQKTESVGRAGPGDIPAWQQGSLVHNIMELIDFNKPFNAIYEIIDNLSLTNSYKQYLLELLAPLWDSGLMRYLACYEHLRREEPFAIYLQNQQLAMEISGEVDLLAYSPHKPALIVDYKVSQPKPDEYQTQMQCYSLAWVKRHSQPPQTVLCFLYDRKCQLFCKQYSMPELQAFERQLLQAGQEMLAVARLADLPANKNCDHKCQFSLWCNS